MAMKVKHTTAPTDRNVKSAPLPTLTELADNPKGITSRHTTAKLFNVHPLTLTRWTKRGIFPKPIIIGNTHFFRNGELIAFLDGKQA